MRELAEVEKVAHEIGSGFPRYKVNVSDESLIRDADKEEVEILIRDADEEAMRIAARLQGKTLLLPDVRYADVAMLDDVVSLAKRMVWGSRVAATALARHYVGVLRDAPASVRRPVAVARELCEALGGASLDDGVLFALLSDDWLDNDTDLLDLWRSAIIGVPEILRAAGFERDSLRLARQLAEGWLEAEPSYASIVTDFHARYSGGGPPGRAWLGAPPDIDAMRAYLLANPIDGSARIGDPTDVDPKDGTS